MYFAKFKGGISLDPTSESDAQGAPQHQAH